MKFVVKTLGCKANLTDSQELERDLRVAGYTPARVMDPGSLDLIVINSCTVTDEADRQSRKLASRLKRENPHARVVMTGCAAEVDPEAMARTPGVDAVISNRDKKKFSELLLHTGPGLNPGVLGVARGYDELRSKHPMDREWPMIESRLDGAAAGAWGESHRTRAFIKIQDGCNAFCTYCVIPYGRGPSRSPKIEQVVEQIRGLVAQGVREVVITGINVGEYGADWSGGVPQVRALFQAILRETDLERLRVSSLDPQEIDDDLIALMRREPRFCPHFHVSLQSPHSRILRLMKRKYTGDDVVACLEKISRVGSVFVGMDVITGFPGESEADFDESAASLRKLPWDRLHVFPYSERAGTPATRLPGVVPTTERKRRAKVLRELSMERMIASHQALQSGLQQSGLPLAGVLIESKTRGPDGLRDWYSGYTRDYRRVLVRARDRDLSNQVVDVLPSQLIIDRTAGDVGLVGTVLSPS